MAKQKSRMRPVETIELSEGRRITVRRADMGTLVEFRDAMAGIDEDKARPEEMLSVRWAVTGVEIPGLEFRTVEHDTFGQIAEGSVVAALYPNEIVAIVDILNGALVSDVEGN